MGAYRCGAVLRDPKSFLYFKGNPREFRISPWWMEIYKSGRDCEGGRGWRMVLYQVINFLSKALNINHGQARCLLRTLTLHVPKLDESLLSQKWLNKLVLPKRSNTMSFHITWRVHFVPLYLKMCSCIVTVKNKHIAAYTKRSKSITSKCV